jgi:hypothetical protein
MEYKVRIRMRKGLLGVGREIDHAEVIGLKQKCLFGFGRTVRNTYVQFGSFDGEFFGGFGEGETFRSFQDALHLSLYDLYQCHEGLHAGDEFVASWRGKRYRYRCEGVHVVLC